MLHGIFSEGYSGTFWEHILKEERLKYLIFKYLSLYLVPRPGTSHRNNRKTKEFIFLIISYLHISYFLHFCPILPVFCYSVHF